MWLRERKLLDEQEDAPPASEINPLPKFMEENELRASDAAPKTNARKKKRNPGTRKRK
jgi:hypothetical protein